ncbi:MAG: PAS domain S-box protein [Arcobacteraceae bacterium]
MKKHSENCQLLEEATLAEVALTPNEYNNILEFQQKILNMIASREKFDLILATLCNLAEQLLPNSVASIMILNQTTGLMNVLSAPSIPQVGHDALKNLKPSEHGGSCGNAVFKKSPQFVSNTFTDPRWKDLHQVAIDFNICSCWSMPIRDDKQNVIGTFALSSFEHRIPSQFHKKLLEISASIVNIVIKNKDDQQKLNLFSNAMQNASDGMIITDENNKIIDVNQAFLDTYGYEIKELLGKNPKILASPKNEKDLYIRMWNSINETSKWSGEIVNKHKNGKEIYQWISISSIENEHRYLAIFTDLTQMVEIQSELLKSKKRYEEIFEKNAAGIFVSDNNRNVVNVNKRFCEIYGYEKEELIGKNASIFHINDESYLEFAKAFQEAKLNANNRIEHVWKTKDGTIIWCEVLGSSIMLGENEFGVIWSVLDITDRKKAEKLLNEQSKMAAMGEMIGNIAHQWRQPLSIISTGATGMQLQKEYGVLTDETFTNTCNMINNNAQYLSKTIDDFRNYIKGKSVKSRFKLKDTISSFLHLLNPSIQNHNLQVILRLDENITISGYENELTQCLINIFNNAKDILNEKNLDDKIIIIETIQKSDSVTISIKDNAGGIAKEILPKVFEPYFTTKHPLQGTGLGLSMSYNLIVDGMDGTIEASNVTFEHDSKTYTGAKFTITLPIE